MPDTKNGKGYSSTKRGKENEGSDLLEQVERMGQREPNHGKKPEQAGYTVPSVSGPYEDHVDKWIPDPKGFGKGTAPKSEPSPWQDAKQSESRESKGKGPESSSWKTSGVEWNECNRDSKPPGSERTRGGHSNRGSEAEPSTGKAWKDTADAVEQSNEEAGPWLKKERGAQKPIADSTECRMAKGAVPVNFKSHHDGRMSRKDSSAQVEKLLTKLLESESQEGLTSKQKEEMVDEVIKRMVGFRGKSNNGYGDYFANRRGEIVVIRE